MQLSHRIAHISYCVDLTDPDGSSVPVAALLLGQCPGGLVGAVATRRDIEVALDPISATIVQHLDAFLRKRVDDFLSRIGDGDVIEQFDKFGALMRNSLHVVDITPVTGVSLVSDEPQQVVATAMTALFSSLATHVEVAASSTADHQTPEFFSWTPRAAGTKEARV